MAFGQFRVMVAVLPALSVFPVPMSVLAVTSVMFPEESPSQSLTIWVFSVPELPTVISVVSSSKRMFSV